MKVSTTQREPREAVLTVELDNDDVEPYLEQAYRQAVRRLAIPGFRKGKAPRRIVEQMYGRGYLLNEALDALIQEFTSKAVEDEGLELGGIPSVSLDDFDPPAFTATVPLQPEVDLGDFESLRVPIDDVEIEEGQVDGVLEQIRTELAVWEPVEDKVQMDDLINLTIVGWVDDEAERRDVVRSEETDYIPRPNTTFPVPGLDEALVGLPVGEESAFDIEIAEDFANPDLASKTAHFQTTVHSVKRKNLAELDDEFAKGVGEGYESIDDLRGKIRADLVERAQRAAQAKHQDEILAKVVEGASIEISPLIVEHEVEHYVHDRQESIQTGRMNFEDYQEFLSWQGLSDEEVHEQARPKVEERLKRAHVLRAVATRQAVEASDEDVDGEIDSIASGSGESADEVRQLFEDPERRESIRRVLVNRKTLEHLSEIALRDGAEPAPEEAPTEPVSDTDANDASASRGEQNPGGS